MGLTLIQFHESHISEKNIITLKQRENRHYLQVQLVFYLPEIAPILEQTKFLVFSARSLQYFGQPDEPLLWVPQ